LHAEHLDSLELDEGLANQFFIQTDATLAIGDPKLESILHIVAASNNRDHSYPMITLLYCMFLILTYGCEPVHTSCLWWTAHWSLYQKVVKNTFTAKYFLKLDFSWRFR